MGTVEIVSDYTLLFRANIITYGNEANAAITLLIRDEIETMWNEPGGSIRFNGKNYALLFEINANHQPHITEQEILFNYEPQNNYFRIENYAHGNISFVDDIGCNTGYLLAENLYPSSTTAAHEFGHTLGLPHPSQLDIRGGGIPGIMYPRGTLVDAVYQYDPSVPSGYKGGTLNPVHRKVRKEDIAALKIHALIGNNRQLVIGDFTNVWHQAHEPGKF